MDLRALLQTADYAGLSVNQAYDLVHQRRHPGERRLTYLGLAALLGDAVARRLAETFDVAGAADALIAEIEHDLRGGATGIDVGNALVQGMLDTWAANGALALTASDAAAIKGLAANQRSDVELHGLGAVTRVAVREAMGG